MLYSFIEVVFNNLNYTEKLYKRVYESHAILIMSGGLIDMCCIVIICFFP